MIHRHSIILAVLFFVVLPVFCVNLVVEIYTGKAKNRYSRVFLRKEDPRGYWLQIFLQLVVALFMLALGYSFYFGSQNQTGGG